MGNGLKQRIIHTVKFNDNNGEEKGGWVILKGNW